MQPENQGSIANIGLLAETSWEVCNKIGGIYTVLSTKARVLKEKFGDKLVFIGPDVWSPETPSPCFKEEKDILDNFSRNSIDEYGITIRTGRWTIPGSPQVILVKFSGVYPRLNEIFGEMWERFGVDSMHEYGDYREGCAFAVASAVVMKHLTRHLRLKDSELTAHFNEWTTGMGLLYLEKIMPEAATIFTTHATSIGRSICGNGKPLYDYFDGYNGDQMAGELNMEAKHSLEKRATQNADCFTAVSDLTAREAEKLLEIRPQVVTPNGFEPDFVPGKKEYRTLRKEGRDKLLGIASKLKSRNFADDTLIVATSGRNEYRNKGLDLFLDSLAELERKNPERDIIGLVLVPAWVSHPSPYLLDNAMEKANPDYITHILHNMDSDSVSIRINQLENEGKVGKKVNLIFIPCYLDGGDGIVNISYYDLLPAIDITVFASYYEPWGYTPLESIAFGLPTITSDKSGFGQWILDTQENSLEKCGVKVVGRSDSNYHEAASEVAEIIKDYSAASPEEKQQIGKAATATAKTADWKFFIKHYYEAFKIAAERRDKRNKN